jgi:DNA modification methylase
MRWLVRLVTPPNGVVLEPFLGSGTTAIAAIREGFQVMGIEREEEYATIARDRFIGDAPLLNKGTGEKTKIDEEIEKVSEERKKAVQQTLFGS